MAARALFLLSLLYLALPYGLFFAGWIRPPWAIVAILLLVATGLLAARQAWQAGESPAVPRVALTPTTALAWLVLALLLAFISGAGGYGFQTHDWIKHEALLRDLIIRPWPVAYDYYTQPVALVYYFAHYLPAAWIGKVAGSGVAHAVLYGWTVLGLLLTFAWFSLLARRATLGILLVFLLFGGLDWIGYMLRDQFGWDTFRGESWRELEDWTDLVLQFDAPVNSLFWAPQHALGGWLAGAMLAFLLLHPLPRLQFVPLALTPFWSPFVTVGLLALLAIRWFTAPTSWRQRFADLFSFPNLASVALLAMVGFYFSAKLGQISPLLIGEMPRGWLPVTAEMAWPQRLGEWGLFLAVEFGLWGLVLALGRRADDVRGLWGSVLVGLVLVSLYSIGLNNDLGMRAAIPLLMLLAAMATRNLSDPALAAWRRGAILGVLVLGSLTPLTEYARQIGPLVTAHAPWQSAHIPENAGLDTLFYDDAVRFTQYVGNASAPFFQTVGKPPSPLPQPPETGYISYGDQILFSTYRFSPEEPVAPGTAVALLLELHVFTRVIRHNHSLQLRLVNAQGEVIWQAQGWPQNRPTSVPAEDIIWFDTRQIALPSDLPPALYRLEMGVVEANSTDADGGDLLPAHWLPGGAPLGELPAIGYLEVGDVQTPTVAPLSPVAQIGEALTLEGLTRSTETSLAPGETITVTLQWAAHAPPRRDLTGFVHLLDDQGTLVAQWDQPPLGGFLPTRVWQDGLRVDDHYPLTIPPDAAAGVYTLAAGLYDPATGQRLPVVRQGAPPRDTVELGTLEVSR